MKIKQRIVLMVGAMFGLLSVAAQTTTPDTTRYTENIRHSRAWEFGLGGSLINWNRVTVTGFENKPEHYLYNLKVNHLMGGANLYIARELNRWFYLDLQGTIGAVKDASDPKGVKHNMLYMGGLGLQWRLSPLFCSKYVEPYLRVGVNYLHKDFQSLTSGVFKDDITGEAKWVASDTWNPKGSAKDKNSFIPLSLGMGVNSWLNNSWGLGLQGEYLMPLEKELPRFAQITMRVMYRWGGEDKRPAPRTIYHTIEKPVEVEKIIEKIVEKEVRVPADPQMCELFANITFEFDKYTLTPESEEELDIAAQILKQYEGQKFLITGFTDARGSYAYNMELSRNRAKAVVEALEKRGVPTDMLKSRGVGKRVVAASADASDEVRRGDRKVTIERITQLQYWNTLPKSY